MGVSEVGIEFGYNVGPEFTDEVLEGFGIGEEVGEGESLKNRFLHGKIVLLRSNG